MTGVIRIATRGSALALVQAHLVRDALVSNGHAVELVIVQTAGDVRAPDTAWGEGAFVAAIERALIDGRADVAVHSAKDVPVEEDPRLLIAAYLTREDARDALVVRAGSRVSCIAELPLGAVIGTDSPRRSAFLRAHRPDLHVRPLHGNVDTRLRRLDDGDADALVLAVAGLARLGRADRITQVIEADLMPPAPGQGAVAVQVRITDSVTRDAVAVLDHLPTRRAVTAERRFLRACGGGCRAPIGAMATVDGAGLRMLGGLSDGLGSVAIDSVELPDHAPMGALQQFAAWLTVQLAGLTASDAPVILVTRPVHQAAPLVRRLSERGLGAAIVPAIAVELAPAGGAFDRSVAAMPPGSWLAVTSANGARAAVAAMDRAGLSLGRVRWAAVGRATAGTLHDLGVPEAWVPSRADGATLGGELPVRPGETVVLARGDLAGADLPAILRARGGHVVDAIAYSTTEAPDSSVAMLAAAVERRPQAVMLASASAVRGFVALAGDDPWKVTGMTALCIGPGTASTAREHGFVHVLEADQRSDEALVDLAAMTLGVPA